MRPPIACLLTVTLLCAGQVSAQSTNSFGDDFEAGASNWQLTGLWSVDGSPGSVAGGAAYSGSGSLNFNDGTSYPGHARGVATASITMLSFGTYDLSFRSNYRTETTGDRYDRRTVRVKVDGVVMKEELLSGDTMGTWREYRFTVVSAVPAIFPPPTPRPVQVEVEFEFDSVDSIANDFPGWFVDDVRVERRSVLPPPPTPLPDFDVLSRTVTQSLTSWSDFLQIEWVNRRISYTPPHSPAALVQPIVGTATQAEWDALVQAVQGAILNTVHHVIPDPRFVVNPTRFNLVCDSRNRWNKNTGIRGSVGVYGAWDGQLRPLMDVLDRIKDRLSGGNQGDDHGDTQAAATPVTVGGPTLNGTIDPPGDVDFFGWTYPVIMIFPPVQATYVIETTVPSGSDTVIELYDHNGTLLASDDDGGVGFASRIVYTGNAGGPYYVKVRQYSSSGTGDYTLKVSYGTGSP